VLHGRQLGKSNVRGLQRQVMEWCLRPCTADIAGFRTCKAHSISYFRSNSLVTKMTDKPQCDTVKPIDFIRN
jgi:hypothetical protein